MEYLKKKKKKKKKNLGPTSVDLIFKAPKVANLGYWKIGPTITLSVQHLHYNTEKV